MITSGDVKAFQGVCVSVHYRQKKEFGMRVTLKDKSDEIAWDLWPEKSGPTSMPLPDVQTGHYYAIVNGGKVKAHTEKTSRYCDDLHNYYILGTSLTRILRIRKDDDIPEFLPRPITLNMIEGSESKFLQVYCVVMHADAKEVANANMVQKLTITDDTGTMMPLLLLSMQKVDSYLAGDVLALRYPNKTKIDNKTGLSCLSSKVCTGIGTPRENELMVGYTNADKNSFQNPAVAEDTYADELAQYKLSIQGEEPDEFARLVEEFNAKHPVYQHGSTSQ